MKLFAGPASPFVRKVRIVIHELGLEDQIDIIMTKPAERAEILSPLNPLVKIPVLLTADEESVYDSSVICEYLAALNPHVALYDLRDRQGEIIPAWRISKLTALGDGVSEAAVNIGAEHRRDHAQQSAAYIERQRTKIAQGIAAFELEIADIGTQVTMPAIAVACALGQVDFLEIDKTWRDRHPAVADWHQWFANRPSYEQTSPQQNPPSSGN